MKKTIYSLFLALICTSCDYLDQKPFSSVTPENFYSTELQMNMALISCYETINTHKIPGITYCQYGSYGQGLLYLMNAPSDDVVASNGTQNEGLEMEWANFNEASRVVRQFWKVFYVGINRCNTILAYIGGIPMDEEKKIQYEAEARFMRAFFYYHLAWNFGGVPIVTSFSSDGTEPRSSLKDVYKFILADLDWAAENLNATGLIDNVSANKYTAEAYIGRICNYLAACKRSGTGADLVSEQPLNDFSFVDADAMSRKAKEALEDVVLNSPYELIDRYDCLFRETTKALQHKECLLLAEIQTSGSEGYWPNSFYVHTPSSGGGVVPTAYGGRHVPTPRGFYMYSPLDPRRDHNYTSKYGSSPEEEVVEGVTYCLPGEARVPITTVIPDPDGGEDIPYTGDHPIFDSPTQTYNPVSGIGVCPGKMRLAKLGELPHTKSQHALSYPLMRLADVYLMYAEALYYCSDETLAREWMNKVLMRAAKGDETLFNQLKEAYHRDDFIQELLESRERELVFEFSRKWDLIRFNLIDDAIASLDEEKVVEMEGKLHSKFLNFQKDGYLAIGIPSLKSNWMHHKIWLPISEEQMAVNPKLTQNAQW